MSKQHMGPRMYTFLVLWHKRADPRITGRTYIEAHTATSAENKFRNRPDVGVSRIIDKVEVPRLRKF